MALQKKNSFGVNLAAGVLALGAAFTPAANDVAQAQEPVAQVQQTKTSFQTISYSQDAGRDAVRWSQNNPTGAAVAVYIGQKKELAPSRIEEVLTREFRNNGIDKVAFFFSAYKGEYTGFSLHENGSSFGPYSVGNVKDNVPKVAEQIKLASSNPVFAYNR